MSTHYGKVQSQVRSPTALRRLALPLMLTISLALIVSSCNLPSSGDAAGVPETLVISFTPEADPVHLELDAEGLARFLSDELGIPVQAQVDADYAATVEAMAAGHAHIATNLAPLQAAMAVDRAGARLILVEERDGQAFYHSRFWVLEDSGIESLEDLRGTTIAFNDPLSGSGYLMPVATLIDAGLIDHGDDIHEFFERVYFAGGTELAIQTLIRGTVDVTGISENAVDIFLRPEDRHLVTYVATSDPMPRHAIAVSGDLPDELVDQITDAFLKLNEPDHNHLLQGLYGWRKVVPADTGLYMPLLDKARAVGILEDPGQEDD